MMKKFVLSHVFLVCLMANAAFADRVEIKAVGTYQYQGKMFDKKKPKDAELASAVKAAKENAWKNYVAGLSESKQKSIYQHESEMQAIYEKSIIDYVVTDSYKDEDTKTLKVALRVAFNDTEVGQYIQKLEVGANGNQGARSGDSLFSFVLVARKVSEVTQYNAKVTGINQSETAKDVAVDGAVTRTNKDIVGGNQTQKSDAVSYEIISSKDLDAAMGKDLTESGIEPVAYDDVVANCGGTPLKKIQTEFVSSDEFSPSTRTAVIKSMRGCEVRYFAYGTVDVGAPSIDSASGQKSVVAKVSVQLWDLKSVLPKKVGSIEATQYSGLGPDGSVAGINALNAAARNVTKSLVDQLNAKGIR